MADPLGSDDEPPSDVLYELDHLERVEFAGPKGLEALSYSNMGKLRHLRFDVTDLKNEDFEKLCGELERQRLHHLELGGGPLRIPPEAAPAETPADKKWEKR